MLEVVPVVPVVVPGLEGPIVALARMYDALIELDAVELVAVELVEDDAVLLGCTQPVTVTVSADDVREGGVCGVVGGGVCAAAAREAARNAAVAVAIPI